MSFHSGATELTEGDDQLDCVKKKNVIFRIH